MDMLTLLWVAGLAGPRGGVVRGLHSLQLFQVQLPFTFSFAWGPVSQSRGSPSNPAAGNYTDSAKPYASCPGWCVNYGLNVKYSISITGKMRLAGRWGDPLLPEPMRLRTETPRFAGGAARRWVRRSFSVWQPASAAAGFDIHHLEQSQFSGLRVRFDESNKKRHPNTSVYKLMYRKTGILETVFMFFSILCKIL